MQRRLLLLALGAVHAGCSLVYDAPVSTSLENSPLRAYETMDPPAAEAPAPVASATAPRVLAPSTVAAGAPTFARPPTTAAQSAAAPPSATLAASCVMCRADSFSPIPAEEEPKAALAFTPMLRQLRACLDRVGGQLVNPIVLVRFTPDGDVTNVRIDTGGFEQLGCVRELAVVRPLVKLSRGTTLRCEYKCAATK